MNVMRMAHIDKIELESWLRIPLISKLNELNLDDEHIERIIRQYIEISSLNTSYTIVDYAESVKLDSNIIKVLNETKMNVEIIDIFDCIIVDDKYLFQVVSNWRRTTLVGVDIDIENDPFYESIYQAESQLEKLKRVVGYDHHARNRVDETHQIYSVLSGKKKFVKIDDITDMDKHIKYIEDFIQQKLDTWEDLGERVYIEFNYHNKKYGILRTKYWVEKSEWMLALEQLDAED